MGKSVYSLVLADEVVEAVDRLAYQMNTSRSNLINQILAERVQCVTPEMRMKDIFSAIEQLMDTRFQFMVQPSDAMISIKSPLRYKYKPTIRYSVELSKDFNGKVGRLKVQCRTQSSALINAISGFFKLWQALENRYISKLFTNGVPSIEEDGRFTRDFYSPSNSLTNEEIGNSIGEYIKLMDECIQIYFDNMPNQSSQANLISEKYKSYLEKGVTIL